MHENQVEDKQPELAGQNAIKGTEPVTVQGFKGWAPEGFDSHPRTNRVRDDYG